MSALPLKADMLSLSIDVRFVPIADFGSAVYRQIGKRFFMSDRIQNSEDP
jgi:hypothetical protein